MYCIPYYATNSVFEAHKKNRKTQEIMPWFSFIYSLLRNSVESSPNDNGLPMHFGKRPALSSRLSTRVNERGRLGLCSKSSMASDTPAPSHLPLPVLLGPLLTGHPWSRIARAKFYPSQASWSWSRNYERWRSLHGSATTDREPREGEEPVNRVLWTRSSFVTSSGKLAAALDQESLNSDGTDAR